MRRDPGSRLRALAVETRAAARSPGRRGEREALLSTGESLDWTARAIEEAKLESSHPGLDGAHSARALRG